MAQLFTNNANSRLVAGISSVSLSLQIAAGDGMKFPNPTGGDFFLVTLSKVTSGIEASVEIIKVTARATDVFTIVRAQEGTTALAYAEGDFVSLRVTAGLINSTEAHKDSVSNPHAVTKAQVGLGNVPNLAFSGSNTGDQTTITGNAGSATTLSAGADRTKLDAITGTNTGDETGSTIRTKLGVTTLSGSNTGDQTIPTTLPASDVYSWAKAATKPSYTAAEVGAQVAGTYATGTGSASGVNTGDQNLSAYATKAGVETLTNKTITDIVFALTGTTPAFTATNGAVQTWTLTAASTPTNALTSGQSIILVITPGANTITWPSVTWTKQGGSGAAPTLFSAGKTSVVLWMVGAVLYGSHLGDNA